MSETDDLHLFQTSLLVQSLSRKLFSLYLFRNVEDNKSPSQKEIRKTFVETSKELIVSVSNLNKLIQEFDKKTDVHLSLSKSISNSSSKLIKGLRDLFQEEENNPPSSNLLLCPLSSSPSLESLCENYLTLVRSSRSLRHTFDLSHLLLNSFDSLFQSLDPQNSNILSEKDFTHLSRKVFIQLQLLEGRLKNSPTQTIISSQNKIIPSLSFSSSTLSETLRFRIKHLLSMCKNLSVQLRSNATPNLISHETNNYYYNIQISRSLLTKDLYQCRFIIYLSTTSDEILLENQIESHLETISKQENLSAFDTLQTHISFSYSISIFHSTSPLTIKSKENENNQKSDPPNSNPKNEHSDQPKPQNEHSDQHKLQKEHSDQPKPQNEHSDQSKSQNEQTQIHNEIKTETQHEPQSDSQWKVQVESKVDYPQTKPKSPRPISPRYMGEQRHQYHLLQKSSESQIIDLSPQLKQIEKEIELLKNFVGDWFNTLS